MEIYQSTKQCSFPKHAASFREQWRHDNVICEDSKLLETSDDTKHDLRFVDRKDEMMLNWMYFILYGKAHGDTDALV